jgi:integrase/recombinase XerC
MKTNSHSKITFSQAINGYLLAAQSHHLSQHMIEDNLNTFRKFGAFIDGDPPLITLSLNDVEAFLAAQTTVSKKTILNYHIGLSALWTWAVGEGLADVHIVHQVERARPEKRQIVPYSEEDIKAMLAALGSSRLYSRPGKKECQNSLPNFERNRATILVLLDTGIRAEEMVELRIHQVDTRNRRLTVFGKGGKERTIPFCARTGQALWRYLAARRDEQAGGFLFSTMDNGPLDRHDLRKTMVRIGMRAGV